MTHQTHNMQETSLMAWEDIQKLIHGRHVEVYHALRMLCEQQTDATDQEIKSFLGKMDANYVRPRRNELCNKKMVTVSQKRKCGVTGKTVIAWKLTKYGGFHYERKIE